MRVQEKYVFKHPQPKRPKSLRIYESHVGMSSPVCQEVILDFVRCADCLILCSMYHFFNIFNIQLSIFLPQTREGEKLVILYLDTISDTLYLCDKKADFGPFLKFVNGELCFHRILTCIYQVFYFLAWLLTFFFVKESHFE